MQKELQSKALEVNLAQTRDIVVNIPDEDTWLITLSENYWGIHKRVKEFFNEYHHPYSNNKEVVEQLSNIAVGDFWLYSATKEPERAFNALLGIFDGLLKRELGEELGKQVVFTLLGFIEKLLGALPNGRETVKLSIDIIEKHQKASEIRIISNLGYVIKSFDKAAKDEVLGARTFSFVKNLIILHIDFWKKTSAIEKWYEANREKLSNAYDDKIGAIGEPFFASHLQKTLKAETWDALISDTLTFSGVTAHFRKFTDVFERAPEKFNYLFYLLHLPGMTSQRDYLLWDLNKVIRNISQELNAEQIIASIDELFILFEEFKSRYMDMVLDSVLTLGKEIMNTSNLKLIHYFEDRLIAMGFVTPGLTYQSNEWRLQVDRNHIKNLRIWLALIEHGPEMMKKLLSALIINLRLGGIFIFDTDLFQRDVTRLLNAEISPIYKQIKQLTRIFPVYFNEIGAEGELREVSTVIDELSQRNDKLIHFLRKQVHTEGNNTHINITREIIKFWQHRDPSKLRMLVPPNVIETIDPQGIWVQGVHEVVNKMCSQSGTSIEMMLELPEKELTEMCHDIHPKTPSDTKRVLLLIKLYQLLKEKYSFETDDITGMLRHFRFFNNEDIDQFGDFLAQGEDVKALRVIYGFMVKLNQIIFDPAVSQGWENIYYKRHIAFGIPSMYGQYHETKFEALGLTFRLERVATLLVERIIANLTTDFITARSLKDIYTVTALLKEGLELDGISDQGLSSNLKMFKYSLTSGSFTVKQYINIFQFMEDNVKEIINKYFIRPYEDLLKEIIPRHFPNETVGDSKRVKQFLHKHSEIFFRDLLFSTFLIQHLDNFIGLILNNLRKMVHDLSDQDIRNVMSYDPSMVISPFDHETHAMDNQVFLGSKAYYLKKISLLGFPVPPGFVITTEVFRRKDTILKLHPMDAEIDKQIKNHITTLEKLTGREFGNPLNPLLFSVRSGSAISMPGAMNTFLNVGLNDEITETLSKQFNFGWTSWDCYRRLLQTWGMSYGLDRNDFDQIMSDYKEQHLVNQKVDFAPEVMREMAFSYKQLLIDHGIRFEPDPFKQLKESIISVFDSWEMPRTRVYRDHMQIADEWGTAVIVQQMVFGNIHHESGSGVLFTHDLHDNTPGISLNGDFSFLSQGEDIVAGLVNTLPVSEQQRQMYYRNSTFSLETAFPKIYKKLEELAHKLIEEHDFSHQEIEFTFETAEAEDLYILQTRDITVLKHTKKLVFSAKPGTMEQVGCGTGIGNEVLNGLLVFDLNDIALARERHLDAGVILVRPDTVPDDIEMIFECDGLITAKGGATSHAAVTAATLGKICVVNCTDLIVNEKEKTCTLSGVGFQPFDPIAIDGSLGIIYRGNYPVKIQEI